jgi:hypothetical protein
MLTSTNSNSFDEELYEEILDFNEKLNKYYELKSIYEETIQDKKKKIKKNGLALRWSKKELADAFQKYSPRCVSCSRDVGTVFDKKKKDKIYHLTATCGSNDQPCQLNLDLKLGDIMDLYKIKKTNEKLIKQYIDEIIIIKNDELFGFINEDTAVEKWNVVNEKLDEEIDEYRGVLTDYLQKLNNSKNIPRIKEINKQLSELVITSKKNVSSFHSTGNSKFIRETAEVYVNEIIPIVAELNSLQYKKMTMEYDKETKEHRLNQKNITKDMFQLHGDAEVISFEMGKQIQNKTQTNIGEPEEEFSQGPLTDNIIDMSMRNATESDDETQVDEEVEQEKRPEEPPTQVPLSSIKLEEDPNESDVESDVDSVISDASSDNEPLPPIKIGMPLDSSSSDGSIPPPPPPPPLDEDSEESK